MLDNVTQILAEAHEVELRLASAGPGSPALAAALADMRAQFAGLIYPGFIAETGAARLPDLVRYLRAIVRRLDKFGGDQARDAERMATVHRVAAEYEAVAPGAAAGRPLAGRRRRDPVA